MENLSVELDKSIEKTNEVIYKDAVRTCSALGQLLNNQKVIMKALKEILQKPS